MVCCSGGHSFSILVNMYPDSMGGEKFGEEFGIFCFGTDVFYDSYPEWYDEMNDILTMHLICNSYAIGL